jgi:hypothetical protein
MHSFQSGLREDSCTIDSLDNSCHCTLGEKYRRKPLSYPRFRGDCLTPALLENEVMFLERVRPFLLHELRADVVIYLNAI